MSEEIVLTHDEAQAHLVDACNAMALAEPTQASGAFIAWLEKVYGTPLIQGIVAQIKAGLSDPAAIIAALTGLGIVVPIWLKPLLPLICGILSKLLTPGATASA